MGEENLQMLLVAAFITFVGGVLKILVKFLQNILEESSKNNKRLLDEHSKTQEKMFGKFTVIINMTATNAMISERTHFSVTEAPFFYNLNLSKMKDERLKDKVQHLETFYKRIIDYDQKIVTNLNLIIANTKYS